MYFTDLQMLENSNSVKRTYHQESRDLILVAVQLCDSEQIILLLSWAHHMFICKMKGLGSITSINTPKVICKVLCIHTFFQGDDQLNFKSINSSSASADSQREVTLKMVVYISKLGLSPSSITYQLFDHRQINPLCLTTSQAYKCLHQCI